MSDLVGVLASTELDSQVSPGLLGFGVVALLGVATYLLVKSMRSRISRIDLPDDRRPGAPDGRPTGPARDAGDAGSEPDEPDETGGAADR